MRWFVLAVVTLLCASTIPASSAGGDGVHWNGYNLDRNSIPNRVLIDQDGSPYSIQKGNADVIVVAFIFTTCVDVCPVITNNLLQAEKQLDDVDYQFISITVDPATDSPEVLKAYMEDYGATWPHLTGDLEDLELVWDDFQIAVLTEEIETHGHDESVNENDSLLEDDMDHSDTVMVAMSDGNSTEYDVQLTGWNLLTASAYQNNWSVNSTPDSFGNMVSAINGDESPSDSSWRWELHTWNMSGQVWESSMTGIDSAEPTNLAFAPNTTDDSLIPMPDMSNISFTVVQSNGTTDTAVLDRVNAWHQSLAALEDFEAPVSEYGHYMNSINNVSAPVDYSWWWQLHYWNMTSESWDESNLGMDDLYDEMHIAWAPNSTMDHMIPAPQMEHEEEVHDHGEEEENQTSTSHSTQTFILDEDWNPMVLFIGYDWNVDDFVEDVERAASTADDLDSGDDSGLPGFTFVTVAASLGLAIIAKRRDD